MREADRATVEESPRSRPTVFAGVGGGFAATTCCVGPAIGIASGAGAASFLLAMGRYRRVLRTRVMGIFPNRASLLRMVGTLLAEQDDELHVVDRRYFSSESMLKIGDEVEGGELTRELVAAIA